MKTCSVEGCNNRIWGRGVCQKHTPKTPLKSSSFKLKKKDENKILDYLVKRNEFFESIWKKRKHYCEECGMFLGHYPMSYHFHHLMPKAKFKDLEFEEQNIMLVDLDCHSKIECGFLSEKVKQRIEEVKEMFNI